MSKTSEDVAEYMAGRLRAERILYQETVVGEILERFGEQFTYTNSNGNPAIGKDVLKAFRKLTKDSAVWMRGERAWRLREPHDGPGRQVDD